MAADPTNFCWVFHVEFLLKFSYGFSVGLDSIFIDFGLGLGWVFLRVWVDYELGFSVGLALLFFFFGLIWVRLSNGLFDLMLILGQFRSGLSTIEMGCSGDGWMVLSWWFDVCHLLILARLLWPLGKRGLLGCCGR